MGACSSHNRVSPIPTHILTLTDYRTWIECDEFYHIGLAYIETVLQADLADTLRRAWRRHIGTCHDTIGMSMEDVRHIVTLRYLAKIR